jgi:hypothetical protein
LFKIQYLILRVVGQPADAVLYLLVVRVKHGSRRIRIVLQHELVAFHKLDVHSEKILVRVLTGHIGQALCQKSRLRGLPHVKFHFTVEQPAFEVEQIQANPAN